MTAPAMDRILSWQEVAASISAPPRKVVVLFIPPEELPGAIKLATRFEQQIQDIEEANAFAQFSMPKVQAFFADRRSKEMSPQERKRDMFRHMLLWAREFRAIYYRATRREEAATKLTAACVGVVVASPPDVFIGTEKQPVRVPSPKAGAIVACHPEDGTHLAAFGQHLAVYGAFLPDMGWEPRYCDWWESIPVEIDMENVRLRAFGNKIVIQLDPKKEMVANIHLPDTAQRWDADATVVSVGPAQRDVKQGERWSVDMSLVTQGGLEMAVGKDFERQFSIPPEALNFKYEGANG